jgi:cobalt/nickel transport system permease protein
VHIPDGFIDAPTSLGAGLVAAGGVGVSLRRVGQVTLESRAALTGLVAAFVFAAQMLNVPVAGGTSGHLIGGVLAAVLVGPWLGTIAMTTVLSVQALVFADGGLSALGLNVVNLALIPCLGGYALFLLLRALLPRTRGGVLAATAVTAWASVVAASLAFVFEYAVGGTGSVPLGQVLGAMAGVHAFVGVGEAAITTLTVGAVLAARPDLVVGAADLPAEVLHQHESVDVAA